MWIILSKQRHSCQEDACNEDPILPKQSFVVFKSQEEMHAVGF